MSNFEPQQPKSVLSQVEEFEEIARRMEDDDVTAVLEEIIKLIAKPDMSPLKAPALIVKIEAIAAKCGILKTYYTSFEKGNTAKKNMYYTLTDKLKDLADALKYLAR